MRTTKLITALVIGMMIVSAMPFFASAQTTTDNLVIALQQDMKDMNAWNPDTNDVWKSFQIGWNFEGLMAYNPDFELYPVLAAEKADGTIDATMTKGGLNIHVNLRENVTFTDGKPMTSKDVVFSYQTLGWGLFQTQTLDALYWDDGTTFTKYDGVGTSHIGVEANGTYGVDFFLPQVFAMFWYNTMAVPICPWHIWQNHTVDLAADDFPGYNVTGEEGWDYSYGAAVTETDATVGTGPMYLESWVKEQGSVIKPYEGYWGKEMTTTWKGVEYPNYPQNVNEIRFKVYTQLDVAILALQNGEVHHLPWSLTPGYYNQLKTDPNIGIETNKDQGFFYMSFNMRKAGINDVNFRRAISYCVDKQYIVDRLMGGYGIQGSVPISVTNTLYVNSTVPAWIQGGNLDAAKALLNANGYTDKDGDGWRDMPDGSPIKFNILTPPKDYDPIRADSGIMIEKNLKSIGLNIAAVPTSFDTIVSAAYVSLDFDMYILGWTVGSFPEAYLKDFFHSESDVAVNPAGSNAAGYNNPTVDALIDEMAVTMDTEERAQIVKDISGIIMNDVAYNTLYYRTNIEAYRKDIWTGWIPAFGTIYNGFSLFNLAPPGAVDDGGDGGSGGSATISQIDGKINAPSMAGAGQTISGSVVATEVVGGVTQPCAGATVSITTSIDESMTLTTGANGAATFELTVPYQRINDVRIDANISKSGAWTNVNKTIGIEFTNHIAKLSLSTDNGVIAPNTTANVTALVTDENGDPLEGVEVSVDTALMFGTVDDATKTTDADGEAMFVYTAPPVEMLPNTHRFEQFKATVMVENTIVPEVQSASLIIAISSDLYDWHDLDIVDVTDYVLDQDGATHTNITLELTDQDGTAIADFPVKVTLSQAGVMTPDAAVKMTNATGVVQFTLTLAPAYTGAGTVVATFNTSKAYSVTDSVAIYVKNDPTFTADVYHLTVTATRDVIYNHYNNTDNTTTLTAILYNETMVPVEGMDLWMGLSDDTLVEVSDEFVATDANGTATFDITCVANGSADIAAVFGIDGGIGIFEGYQFKVNQTAEPIAFNEIVTGEHVFGPSVENSRYWYNLLAVPVDHVVKVWNPAYGWKPDLAQGVNYTLTGNNITYINKLWNGDSVFVWYNYTTITPVLNETVTTGATGGEMGPWNLVNTPIVDAKVFKDNAGTWTELVESTDYTLNMTSGAVDMLIALAAGDSLYAYYNYSTITPVANETVFAGPAVAGEIGPWNLAHLPNNAAVIKNEATPLTITTDYTLAGTTLTLVNPLENGEDIFADYEWTRSVANHRLDVDSVSSWYIDSNPFANATPETSDIVVKFTATDGTPVNGKNITAIAWGEIGLVNDWALTNATGHAVFTATSITAEEAYAAVYFLVEGSAGVSESVTLYNAPYVPGYAADIDFDIVAGHDSAVDITATVYGADGNPAPDVRCMFFIPPTAEGIPGVFQGGDDWGWTEYGSEWNMGDWAGYLGSWFESNATYTDANGQLVATIDTASFIADAAIPLYFGVGGTGVAAPFNYSSNNWWMEYYPEYGPPLQDDGDVYYWLEADFTLLDQSILRRAPMATLAAFEMDKPFISEADNTTTFTLTFQDLDGALNAIDVFLGQGTASPATLDEGPTSAAGVFEYDYTADVGDFDAGIAFTATVTDSGYAKFPFNFYIPYLANGITANTLVATVESAAMAVAIGDNVTLDVTVTDEYGRAVAAATVAYGTNDATTNANGVAQLVIPTATQTAAGIFEMDLDVTKGAMSTEESFGVILTADTEVEMADIVIGPVLDKDDAPIEGALVSVSLSATRQTAYTGTTNATGYATISVPASFLGQTVSVTITKTGYETVTYTTALSADGTSGTAPPAFNEVEEEGGISMALIAVIVIVVVVLLVVVLVVMPKMKAGKPEGPAETKPEPEEETPAEAPAEEMPEEAPAEPKADE